MFTLERMAQIGANQNASHAFLSDNVCYLKS